MEDPDFSASDSLPGDDAPKISEAVEATTSKDVPAAVGKIAATNQGDGVRAAAGDAAEIASAGRVMGGNAAIAQEAARQVKAAEATWKKDAPTAKEISDAEKALADAKKQLGEAQTAEDAARDKYNAASTAMDNATTAADVLGKSKQMTAAKKDLDAAVEVTKKAQEAVNKARDHVQMLKARRKAANEALTAARKRIAALLGTVNRTVCGKGVDAREGGTGRGSGRPGTVNMPGYTEKYTPGAGPGAGTARGIGVGKTMPSMPTTPSKPTETGTGRNGGAPDATSQALAQLLHGQQQQQPQATAAAPQQAAATQPQQATQPQPEQKKDDGKKNGKDALDVDDVERALKAPDNEGVINALLGGGSPLSSSAPVQATGPQSAPSGQYGYSPRPGVQPLGTTGGGAPLNATGTQQVTTGESKAGLTTPADTTGRPEQPRTAVNDGLKTTTSAATNTAAEQQTQQQNQRTGGAPMGGVPMHGMPGGGGGSGGGSQRKESDPVLKNGYQEGGMTHGQKAVGEATPGGTICRNTPTDPKPGKAA